MNKIKFGTDGWRAIIAKDYTTENVARVSLATSEWILENATKPSVVIGYDCRFGGELFTRVAVSVFLQKGIRVYAAKGFVSTPMVSLSTLKRKANAGIVITASHNPPSYNGFKIKAQYGGPALQSDVSDVEARINDVVDYQLLETKAIEDHEGFEWIDMEQEYIDHVHENFDIDAIRKSGLKLGYDAMYGAGQNVVRRLLPDAFLMHAEYNPGFNDQAPEPIARNLQPFAQKIKELGLDSGLATDGDADRIGLFNNKGDFVDSHHLILLLIRYLVEYKKYTGNVYTSFSCTSKIELLCKHYDLHQKTTKIGFKYICEEMIQNDTLLGGEESGGIAVKGHIPERDGIWMGLVLWEYMAKSGKSLDELIDDVYQITGSFAMDRYDLHVAEDKKKAIIEKCKNGSYQTFGTYTIKGVKTTDGFKFDLGHDEWVMIRPSGTEPLLRVYAQSNNHEQVIKILDETKEAIL